MNIIKSYKAWKHKRQWPIEQQVATVQQMLEQDHKWLSHDPKLAALCKRYIAALASDWMHTVHRSSGMFRADIGAQPLLVKPSVGSVRFFPVYLNGGIGPPHTTFYGASQVLNVQRILKIEIHPADLTVTHAVALHKVTAAEVLSKEIAEATN